MFNLSGSEVIVILLLAPVVLGPEKLPEAMRKAGKAYNDLKRMSTGFQQEFRAAMDEPMREVRSTADLMRSTIEGTVNPPTKATTSGADDAAPDLSGPDHPMLRAEGLADTPAETPADRDGPPSEPDPPAPAP